MSVLEQQNVITIWVAKAKVLHPKVSTFVEYMFARWNMDLRFGIAEPETCINGQQLYFPDDGILKNLLLHLAVYSLGLNQPLYSRGTIDFFMNDKSIANFTLPTNLSGEGGRYCRSSGELYLPNLDIPLDDDDVLMCRLCGDAAQSESEVGFALQVHAKFIKKD